VNLRLPVSLRLTVPLVVLSFAVALSAFNVFYHVPHAEQAVEDDVRKRVAQEMSRLQSTLEYLMLKGDRDAAQHEIAVLAHNHDYVHVALTDDHGAVIAATRRAWLGRGIHEVLPKFDPRIAAQAIRARSANLSCDDADNVLVGYAGILLGRQQEELQPSRSGSLFLAYDLNRPKAEARAQVLQQSLYWAGWVAALALVMWLVFHFLLTRRTARLVQAAEALAAGDLAARSGLRGRDELGRLGRAFDAMAGDVAATQNQLRRDIAERQRTEEALRVADVALRASEEHYRSMFNASIDGLALWNAHGELVDTNPALWQMYGYCETALPSLPASQFAGPGYPTAFLQAVAAGATQQLDITELRTDGAAIDLEVHGIPMQYRGKPHVLTIARDVTEKKRSAAQLTQQREALYQREKLAALGTLLAGVAHELNNPLSVVVARAVMLEEQGDPATHAAAVKIRTAAERCARIARTFLSLARQQQPTRSAVAVNDVVSAALDLAAYAVRASAIEVRLDLAKKLPLVLADADQLHQVVLNLIINAQQALQDEAGARLISVRSRHDTATQSISIAITDNGPGIPAPLRARVFEPYFTTKPVGIGTGIGLAVSFSIVEAHGGTLTVACPAAGGTEFTINLPIGATDAERALLPRLQPHVAQRCAVLVVDDEADIRDTLTEILTAARHTVVSVPSGREALAQLSSTDYDVIFTDVRMPDLDGPALYQEIEHRWPERARRVVFVTGDTLAASFSSFAAANGCPVIEKPFLPAEVRRIVNELARNAVQTAVHVRTLPRA
jgi:PAS domain S-box-containing protein